MINCLSCSQSVYCVCLPCGVEYCGACDSKLKSHIAHKKQLITNVISRCQRIRVTLPSTDSFEETRSSLLNAVEKNLSILTSLQQLQGKFEGYLTEAEYHCELSRLSRKFNEEKTVKVRRDILQKIISKSSKCGFELDDENMEDDKLFDINIQLSEQGKLTKSLQEDIKRLHESISQASTLFDKGDNKPKSELQNKKKSVASATASKCTNSDNKKYKKKENQNSDKQLNSTASQKSSREQTGEKESLRPYPLRSKKVTTTSSAKKNQENNTSPLPVKRIRINE